MLLCESGRIKKIHIDVLRSFHFHYISRKFFVNDKDIRFQHAIFINTLLEMGGLMGLKL